MLDDDTGPQEDGTRSAKQWLAAMGEDVSLINLQVKESLREGIPRDEVALHVAVAQKEALRLVSDIKRFAKEVHNLTEEDLDKVGPL